MSTKREIINLIEKLPEDVSLEEIIFKLYVRSQILKGLKDLKEGKSINARRSEKDFKIQIYNR